MRKVVVYELLSLDGVAEAPDTFIDEWDDLAEDNLATVIKSQDLVVLGRQSHDEWARFWPTSDIEPFASFINGVQKYVATSSPLSAGWSNATAIDGDLVDFVHRQKNQDGGDIGVHASITVARALLTAGVVDELRVVIAAAVAGSGRKLLDGVPPLKLETIEATTSTAGHVLVGYRLK